MKEYENEIKRLRDDLDALEKSIKERPEPKLEVGKSYRSDFGWVVINRKGDEGNYGFNPDGEFQYGLCCSIADEWKEIPESEAIALLEKECVKWGGEDWRDVKIEECAYDRSTSNHGNCKANVFVSQIWNRNGCIFYEGKWAEKLEEPEVKEGQMIWGKLEGDCHWIYGAFSRIDESGNVTIKDYDDHDEFEIDQYSILNPYPESIESRAIELLRRIYDADEDSLGYRESIVSTLEFLKEIDTYENP